MGTNRVDGSAARRDEILDAAIEAFGSFGYAKTTMSDIANVTTASRAALYLHFENKEAIFRALVDRTYRRSIPRGIAALAVPGPTAERLGECLVLTWGDDVNYRLVGAVAEVVNRRPNFLEDIFRAMRTQIRQAFRDFLIARSESNISPEIVVGWLEMLMLAPIGLGFGRPPLALYQRRMRSLASAVASEVDQRNQ